MSSLLLLHTKFMCRGVGYLNRKNGLSIATTYLKSLHVDPRIASISATRKEQVKREERNIAKIEASDAVINTGMTSRLRKFESVDNVLGFVDKQKVLKPIDIGLTLRRILEINSKPGASQQTDATSINLSIDDRIAKLVQRLPTHEVEIDILFFILISLRKISHIDPQIIRSVETKVREGLGQMSISQLVRVVNITSGVAFKNSESSNTRNWKINSSVLSAISKDISNNKNPVAGTVGELSLCDDALANLERRWVEISSPQDIVTLMYVLPHDANDRLWARVNERVLERSEVMSARQLYRVLYGMARRQRRNTPVIRSVVYHMNKRSLIREALPQSTSLYSTSANTELARPNASISDEFTASVEISDQDTVPNASFTLVQLTNLVYACANLNIRDHTLLRSIVIAIKSSFDNSPNVNNIRLYSSILQSLAALRWLDEDVINRISSMFISLADKVTVSQWSSLIMSCSSLGYLPSSLTRDTVTSVFERLREDHQMKGYSRALLDIVWSSAVLNVLTVEMATSVLNKDFVNSLELSCSSNPIAARLKLLNIDAIVKHTMLAENKGPALDEEYVNKIVTALNVRRHGVLKKTLLDTLNKIASAEKYLRVDVKTSAGYHIDVELFTNDKGQLQPVADYTKVIPSGQSVLPSGIHRFAIKLLDASDMTLGKVQPTGLNILCSRHLAAVGYKVIQIPHNELSHSTTIVKRVQYIHARIMDGLKGTSTWSCSTSSPTEDKLNKETSKKSKKGKSDAGSASQQTEAKGLFITSDNSYNAITAECVEKKGDEKMDKMKSRKDDGKFNDAVISSRTDEQKQQQLQSKSKPKSVSLDVKELYDEQSTSVKQNKHTSVTNTKRRN